MPRGNPTLRVSYRNAYSALQDAAERGTPIDYSELQRESGSLYFRSDDIRRELTKELVAIGASPKTERTERGVLRALQAKGRLPDRWPLYGDDKAPVYWTRENVDPLPEAVRLVRELTDTLAESRVILGAHRSATFHRSDRGVTAVRVHIGYTERSGSATGWALFLGSPRFQRSDLGFQLSSIVASGTPSVLIDMARAVPALIAASRGADRIADILRTPGAFDTLAGMFDVSRRTIKSSVLRSLYGGGSPTLGEEPRLGSHSRGDILRELDRPLQTRTVSDTINFLATREDDSVHSQELGRTLAPYLATETVAAVGRNPGLMYATPRGEIVVRRGFEDEYLEASHASISALGLGSVDYRLPIVD